MSFLANMFIMSFLCFCDVLYNIFWLRGVGAIAICIPLPSTPLMNPRTSHQKLDVRKDTGLTIMSQTPHAQSSHPPSLSLKDRKYWVTQHFRRDLITYITVLYWCYTTLTWVGLVRVQPLRPLTLLSFTSLLLYSNYSAEYLLRIIKVTS